MLFGIGTLMDYHHSHKIKLSILVVMEKVVPGDKYILLQN